MDVNVHTPEQRAALAQQPSLAGQQTLAQRLSEAGYHCGLSGKWHCGDDDLPQPGFAFWDALRRNTVPRDGGYSVDGQLVERRGWHSEIITDNALRFLRQRKSDQPFFLFVGYIGAHSPWRGHPQRLVERYRDASFADIPQDEAWPHGNFTGEGREGARPARGPGPVLRRGHARRRRRGPSAGRAGGAKGCVRRPSWSTPPTTA